MAANPGLSLATLPATPSQQRLAYAVLALSALAFAAMAPFAKTPLPPQLGFIPSYQSALIAADLMTAVVLFSQYHALRSRALFALACGYLFTAFAAAAHLLTFPGLFAPGGLLGAGPQSTAWIYMFWHGAFPLFVLAYARQTDREDASSALPTTGAVAGGVVAMLALAAASLLIATAGHSLLPPIMDGNRYTPAMIGVVGTVWLLSLAALVVVWRKPRRSILDLWLAVVMCAWLFDIALAAVLNGGRFDLGFYAGRIYGLIAATVVLVVLLVEHGRLVGRLARAHEHEREEQAKLAAANVELVAAREAAVAADRAKDVFLATMSHEIRTPMNGVLGLLELLSLSDLEPEQAAQVATVQESAQSLLRIIDDLLDFSKIEAGRLDLFPEATSVARVVQLVAESFRGAASSKKLLLESRIDPRIPPRLWVDGMRLRQVLNNLASNAIKFTDHGRVVIAASLESSEGDLATVRFEVIDTGVGIPEADQQRLFQPFVQATSWTTRKYGGTGLGLSICRRLAEMMSGEVALRSEPGQGTTVMLTIRLKRVDVDEAEAAPVLARPVRVPARRECPSVEEAEREGTLVLAADDHPINRMVLQRQLASIGYASEVAEDGRQALEMWRTGRFSLIVTDCHMPEMDGYQLTQTIRNEEAGRQEWRTPIIAFTANAMAGEADQCIAAGMDDYLAKPVQIRDLATKLDRWLPLHARRAVAAPGED
ncbi:MAG TPA: MASE4 domain-containing protein [Usitatibacter sp.]|nr:MASE4 domain-containing protein [Usitatibacter sp.]